MSMKDEVFYVEYGPGQGFYILAKSFSEARDKVELIRAKATLGGKVVGANPESISP